MPVQLSQRVFQSEKEFYAPIRLRHPVAPGRSQVDALRRNGVVYLELRFLDRDPYHPGGVDPKIVEFLRILLIHGAGAEVSQGQDIYDAVARADEAARLPIRALLAGTDERVSALLGRAHAVIDAAERTAALLDSLAETQTHTARVDHIRARLERPEQLPSVRIARDIEAAGVSWTRFGIQQMERQYEQEHTELCRARV